MSNPPSVDTMEFTFNLEGDCIYCKKKCKRSRTYQASSTAEAQAKAKRTMEHGIWHRKCGLS